MLIAHRMRRHSGCSDLFSAMRRLSRLSHALTRARYDFLIDIDEVHIKLGQGADLPPGSPPILATSLSRPLYPVAV